MTTSAAAAAGRLLERIRVVRDVPRLDLGEEVVESPKVHRYKRGAKAADPFWIPDDTWIQFRSLWS